MTTKPGFKLADAAAPAGLALASAVVLLATGSRSPDAGEAAGVFPPWWSRSQVMQAAAGAGQVRDLGAAPFIIVIRDPDGQAAEKLRRAGALFSVAPSGSAVCAS